MIPLPCDPSDAVLLADWLEILALLSPDGNASSGDLSRVLKRESVFEDSEDEDEEIEHKCQDVFDELDE